MPRSRSPPRGPRQRSRSPRHDRPRSRSRSPPRGPRKPKELSFYKKTSSSTGSFSNRRDPLEDETARDRMERRDRGEVPARFGGTREQGVRNTMSAGAPVGSSVGSLKRGADPLDRMGVRGGEERRDDGLRERQGESIGAGGGGGGGDRRNGDQAREERVQAMDKTERRPAAVPTSAPVPSGRLIEVIANDRLGRKVRIKCLPTDTVGDLKRLIAAQTGTTAQKIQLKKWYTSFKDHVTLRDYEINDGMSLEMY